jgi:hypothetical protein
VKPKLYLDGTGSGVEKPIETDCVGRLSGVVGSLTQKITIGEYSFTNSVDHEGKPAIWIHNGLGEGVMLRSEIIEKWIDEIWSREF